MIQRGLGVRTPGLYGTFGALASMAICLRLYGSKMNS